MSRVLLIYHNALFALSMHAVLRTAAHIHLVGELQDWARIDTEIARLAPDIILLEDDEAAATDAMLATLRTRLSAWRVVALRLDETTMHVWSGDGKVLQKTEELISTLSPVPGKRMNPHTARMAAPADGGR